MLNFIGEYFSPREQREDAPPAAGSGDAEASEAAPDPSPPAPDGQEVEQGASGEDLTASGAAEDGTGAALTPHEGPAAAPGAADAPEGDPAANQPEAASHAAQVAALRATLAAASARTAAATAAADASSSSDYDDDDSASADEGGPSEPAPVAQLAGARGFKLNLGQVPQDAVEGGKPVAVPPTPTAVALARMQAEKLARDAELAGSSGGGGGGGGGCSSGGSECATAAADSTRSAEMSEAATARARASGRRGGFMASMSPRAQVGDGAKDQTPAAAAMAAGAASSTPRTAGATPRQGEEGARPRLQRGASQRMRGVLLSQSSSPALFSQQQRSILQAIGPRLAELPDLPRTPQSRVRRARRATRAGCPPCAHPHFTVEQVLAAALKSLPPLPPLPAVSANDKEFPAAAVSMSRLIIELADRCFDLGQYASGEAKEKAAAITLKAHDNRLKANELSPVREWQRNMRWYASIVLQRSDTSAASLGPRRLATSGWTLPRRFSEPPRRPSPSARSRVVRATSSPSRRRTAAALSQSRSSAREPATARAGRPEG